MPQPALEPLRPWDPEQIGGYVLVGRLGAGAMGRVYLGRSAAGRLVAVKTIKVELAEEPEFRTRFAQEVAAARRVSGAFTAAVVAADPEADVPWLATAYVPAPALSAMVRACGPLPVPAVRWLAAGCAEALESIHAAGLVHRDLKPSNVLVSPDGPRVIDFGVARAAERIQLTVTRGAVGTPAYMAPEQARDTRQATMASDVFSLGATMLFAATGHAPYQGETVMDVLVRLATEPPDLSDLPGDLADIVGACLDRDPRRRPAPALVLARMAPGARRDADHRELGPGSLPASALELIAEYRPDPWPSRGAMAVRVGDADSAEDATFGSLPVPSEPDGPPASRRPGTRRFGRSFSRSARLADREGGHQGRAGPPSGRRAVPSGARRHSLQIAAWSAAAVAALAAAGAGGFAVADNRPPPAQPPSSAQPPPGLGPAPPRQLSALPGKGPQIALYQSSGDGNTVFVVHGVGWAAGQRVTVALSGVGVSPEHPVVDGAGTFSYAINQDHEFFPGALPIGKYRVVVTTAAGASATASFVVYPGPRSTTGPPGGSTTPGR